MRMVPVGVGPHLNQLVNDRAAQVLFTPLLALLMYLLQHVIVHTARVPEA